MKQSIAILVSVVSLAVSLYTGFIGGQELGGTVENFPTRFTNGLYAGTTDQFSISSTGAISTSGNLATTGIVSSTTGSSSFDDLLVSGDATFGASAASGAGGFVAQFLSTGTTSIDFDSGTGKGTCFIMVNNAGTRTYVRIVGTTLTANTTSCR